MNQQQAVEKWEQGLDAIAEQFNLKDAESYEENYSKAKYQADKLSKSIKVESGLKKLPSNWWNKRAIRDDASQMHDDSQAIIDELWAERFPEATQKAIKNAVDEAMESEAVQTAMSRTGLSQEQFIVEAIYAYVKANQSKVAELSKIPTAELKGSKKAGHGEVLCERAVKAIITHNQGTKNTDARYQITYPVIKALTNCSTSVMERVLGNPTKGVQGTMRDEINEHHESLGMISKVYNRGKSPVTDYVQL